MVFIVFLDIFSHLFFPRNLRTCSSLIKKDIFNVNGHFDCHIITITLYCSFCTIELHFFNLFFFSVYDHMILVTSRKSILDLNLWLFNVSSKF